MSISNIQLDSTPKQKCLKKRQLKEDFANPSTICRGKPFWAWNDLCEEKELRRQIRIFKEMGFGGFFMHARTGLKTKYLSKEWFNAVKVCVDEANKIGLEAWLYDEDRWPSGTAGGLVTKDPQYRMKCLKFEKIAATDFSWEKYGSCSFVFTALFRDTKLIKYIPVSREVDIEKIEEVDYFLVFRIETVASLTRYNGQAYTDTLNPEAVRKFIEITHEAYLREIGNSFGSTVLGIFTDEPNCRDGNDKKAEASWTDKFPEYFQKHFGYDITRKLPELFFDMASPLFSKARYDYYACRSQLFTEAFAKQIGQWCRNNNLFFTGHGIEESPLSEQASSTGSLMQFYAYMQIPGIDMLTDYRSEYITPKQCSSVARQFGRKWVLSELYGCTGWDTTFETYKYIGDWQAALGVTMRCPHLSWYSMAGEAKRDYPASIHFHSPWWKQFKKIEDYFARINSILSQGQAVCNVAMVNPIESFYFLLRADAQRYESGEETSKFDKVCRNMACWLLNSHIDFDYVDEALLPDQEIKIVKEEDVILKIGKMEYRVIVIPPILTIRKSTLQILKEFSEQGGIVIFVGDAPDFVDGSLSEEAKIFSQNKCIKPERDVFIKFLKSSGGNIYIENDMGEEIEKIFYQLRKVDNDLVLFIVNIDRNKDYNKTFIRICYPAISQSQVQLWDAVNNKRYSVTQVRRSEFELKFKIDISAGQSRLFLISKVHENLSEYVTVSKTEGCQIKCDQWDYLLDDDNVLVLDRADCTVMQNNQEIMSLDSQEILRIDDLVREKLNYSLRTGTEIQPWAKERTQNIDGISIKLKYEFFIDDLPQSFVKLAIEQPANWKIRLNEHLIDMLSELKDWWVDPAIKTLPIHASFLCEGRNMLTIEGTFNEDTDLEVIYLLGNFAVATDGIKSMIQKMPTKFKLGSVTNQGLPFYGGNILYKSSFYFDPKLCSRYWLGVKDFNASAIEISINGNQSVLCSDSKNSIEITDVLKKGFNEICINLLGSRRNSFGPLHMADEKPVYVSAASFRQNEYYKWQEKYKLVEYGMYQFPVIYEYES
ncbi:MAG: hypothetical protein A2Y10_01195 [Planctomycetes bacterium GWF2_41_51]|nr:MAG: hypothetical protein A2Y10_01195 [Planctomycetes bacterium GWF2_41_51]HBG25618.1 hypothetical protein [Phycisphaerales bacterium]